MVRDLSIGLTPAGGPQRPAMAVAGVSLDLPAGRCLSVVGESGSGKTLLAYGIADLLPPVARVVGGDVLLHGESLMAMAPARRRALAGREIGFVFQEPGTALNPVLTVGWQIAETARIRGWDGSVARQEALKLLQQLQVRDPQRMLDAYPHQLSGGMKQRAVMAMALMLGPSLLIADEPTTALDVTIQAQILSLMRTLQQETGTAIVLITHDLGVVAEVADEVVVMYAGRIVERAPVGLLFDQPQHPYTVGLLGSIPRLDADRERLASIDGQVPPPNRRPPGCGFADRCPFVDATCRNSPPPLRDLGDGHWSACFKAPLDPAALLAPENREALA